MLVPKTQPIETKILRPIKNLKKVVKSQTALNGIKLNSKKLDEMMNKALETRTNSSEKAPRGRFLSDHASPEWCW